GFGLVGICDTGKAIEGRTGSGTAVVGLAKTGTGIIGLSDTFAVVGVSDSGKAIEGRTGSGTAIVGLANDPNGHAGVFLGRVQVNRDIELSGGDVIVRGTALLAGLQSVQGIVNALQGTVGTVAALRQELNLLEQKVAALQSQVNTAISNLTGRVSLT